jgi:hypothetical protein
MIRVSLHSEPEEIGSRDSMVKGRRRCEVKRVRQPGRLLVLALLLARDAGELASTESEPHRLSLPLPRNDCQLT